MAQVPRGQKTVKTLNTGASVTLPIVTQILGYVVYVTQAGALTLYNQTSTPIPVGNADLVGGPILTTNPAPTDGLAGVAAPEVAPPVTHGGSGSGLAAGTYQVAIAWVTRMGVSPLSPTATVTILTGEFIEIQPAPATIPAYAFGSLSTGFGTAILTVPNLEDWTITRYAVFVTTTKATPAVSVYVDSVSPIFLLDTTALGGQNSANADVGLRPGQQLIAVWTGADLGATCTLSVYGTKLS